MVGINLFLRVNCVSMSNLLVLPSMFLISSINFFLYYQLEVKNCFLIALRIGHHAVLRLKIS